MKMKMLIVVLLSGQPTKKHGTVLSTLHPFLYLNVDNLHAEAPSELLELQQSSLVYTRYKDLGADFKK